jgi:hypothetical protein
MNRGEEERVYVYGLMVGKPEGMRPLGRPRLRWVDHIEMELGEVGWGGVNTGKWRAVVNSVTSPRFP